MSDKENTLPEWFNGELYDKGAKVSNPFTGESFVLDAEELSMYDFIHGYKLYLEMRSTTDPAGGHSEIINETIKGMEWFKEKNLDAYQILLA